MPQRFDGAHCGHAAGVQKPAPSLRSIRLDVWRHNPPFSSMERHKPLDYDPIWVRHLTCTELSLRFVADFTKKYRYMPSLFSESSYDAAQLIDSAVNQLKGNLSDKNALRKAIEKADIQSPRGSFKFNTNHFPIHASYVVEAVKKSDGTFTLATEEKLREAASDSFAVHCPMK
jgi:branched-chain amino acid transport system substrate-binding protein